jgi:serine protease AprX
VNTVIFKNRLAVCVFVLVSINVIAQNRYMVFFKDKTGSSYSISQPLQFLSQRALDRRVKEDIRITEQDFPVNANYVQLVKNTGAEVYFQTRWMNGLLIQCQPSLLPTIQALSCVQRVEFVAPQPRLLNSGRRNLVNKKNAVSPGAETTTQLEMLGIPEMHEDNILGEGVTIAVFDGGFPGVNTITAFQDLINTGRINLVASKDFVTNSKNVFQYDDHGTAVLSTIAAYVPDLYTGGAFNASFQLYITEDNSSEFRVEEYNWMFAAERADSAGVDVISSSLGYSDFDMSSMNYTTSQMDGKTAVVTKAAQWAADRGIIVVCSAGNEGDKAWRIITAPADAEGVIAVANVNSKGVRSSSSSIGPTADSRIKPDLAALGTGVKIFKPNGGLSSASGTSLAAPLVTSLVAGLIQRFPQHTSRQIIAAMKHTASQGKNPDNLLGYGIPHYSAVENYLDQVSQSNPFELFPNPATDTIGLRPFDPEKISTCTVEIISAQGQQLREDTVTFDWLNRKYETDISTLAPGFYYFKVLANNQRYIFKLIKK